MSRLPVALSALALLLCASPALLAAEDASAKDGKFKMGEVTVVVSANADPVETANSKVEAEAIQQLNRDDLSSALALVPGISISAGGARNETTFYLRGNDPRQVPVFVDGVPCYIPYDGNIDYSRFTTFDVAEIQVAKGFSSIGYGANTLGGAINVVTRKPVNAFEGDARVGAFEGNGKTAALNLGTNKGWWYAQGGLSYTKADSWRMSSDFVPNTREDGGARDNSYFSDKKLSMKLGITPNSTDEYTLGVVRQRGDKGDPVSTLTTATPRYWRWPMWNMDSTFLVTRTALGSQNYVKFRAYFDRYENGIDGYTNATYSTLHYKGDGIATSVAGPTLSDTGHSRYKDYSHGLMGEFGTMALPGQNLKFIVQTKTDVHREGGNVADTGDTEKWAHFEDRYLILGVEDSVALGRNLDLSLGAGMDKLKAIAAGATWTPYGNKSLFHAQAGLFWKATDTTKLYATFAQKDHFATLKDRYSSAFGTYIPNPDLKPETSRNYEIGVKSTPLPWMQIEGALFESDITNLIQAVTIVANTTWQKQNIGKVSHKGVELSVGINPNKYVRAGMGYTYLNRANESSTTPLTGTPKCRLAGYVRVDPVETLYVQASVQAQNRICDSTTPTYVSGFTTADLALGWQPTAKLSIDGGFKNALDKNYQYSTGYPMPGRTWFANARYKF